MKIIVHVGKEKLTATLDDNPTSKDFYARLPLDMALEDYAKTEKIAYFQKALSTEQASDGCSAKRGDITYYAPWGNLAIFYRDFGFAAGLIKLGEFTCDISPLLVSGKFDVRIEKAPQ